MSKRLKESRLLLQNPYAYEGEHGFEYSTSSTKHRSQKKTKTPEPTPEVLPNKSPSVRESRIQLQNPYAHLDGDGNFVALASATENTYQLAALNAAMPKKQRRYSEEQIEKIAQNILKAIWKLRYPLYEGAPPEDPTKLLNPAIVLRGLGYEFEKQGSLGHFGSGANRHKVAGYIDNDEKKTYISEEFPSHIQNFTAAHELAHAVLHQEHGLHRDRAIDGASKRSGREWEADKFATFFLMPTKLMKRQFRARFLCEKFKLTPETAFALNSPQAATKIKSVRDLSRLLASSEYYNGERFISLAHQFNVSVEAMAIRLEEIGIVS
ncbi:ImmA/IrrE family metallo-endopeptidase [Spongiibacter sp. KMU-166]|uniref:ImmA/IrrE family metallo-endopeptidase n=1 Tax=Spongiibacter thalassae TaxID=2721624 RepID=A0ABX1GKA5_9GAMM|nr:ImmA/IrrE family metallo-endopeptidase [Spongiibacter thalassae]NKI19395.1 ImmA/IrrE family metallo-endopeptidase [Spongiibacter thalassae]